MTLPQTNIQGAVVEQLTVSKSCAAPDSPLKQSFILWPQSKPRGLDSPVWTYHLLYWSQRGRKGVDSVANCLHVNGCHPYHLLWTPAEAMYRMTLTSSIPSLSYIRQHIFCIALSWQGLPERLTFWAEFPWLPDHSKNLMVNAKIMANKTFDFNSFLFFICYGEFPSSIGNGNKGMCENLYVWCCYIN